ncbi:MAG: YbaB/EbfC family nucleoid-associated protein [Clostridia bacterium]|nr:YbaB/EbfC family nucleoid-associated protein [Clostridia bacterium]
MANYGGFGGGFGGGMNLQNLARQAQKMQEEMLKKQEELEAKEFTASVGGGAVKVVMTGDRQIKNLEIKPAVVDPDDIETLQDLVVAGVNDVLEQIEEAQKATMPQMPGMF